MKQSDLGLLCLTRPFWQTTSVRNFRTFSVLTVFSAQAPSLVLLMFAGGDLISSFPEKQ